MFKTLRDAWKIPELRKKLMFTAMLLLIYRLVSAISLPVVDAKMVAETISATMNSTILGLFDMAVRKSAGTALMQPIAVVCIGGLVYATLMTLFVVPCIYDLLNKKELRNIREEDLKLLDL